MDEKTEVLLEKEFSGKSNNQSEGPKAGEIALATIENFSDSDWEEPKQSDIETRVYDRDARFYEYDETVTSALPGSAENRSSKRAFLTIGLLILGGFSLFSAAAAAIYNFSGKMFPPPAAVRQVDVNEPPQNESGDKSYDESRDNAFDPAKALKSSISEDKNISEDKKSPETLVKKEKFDGARNKAGKNGGTK